MWDEGLKKVGSTTEKMEGCMSVSVEKIEESMTVSVGKMKGSVSWIFFVNGEKYGCKCWWNGESINGKYDRKCQ